MSYTNKDIGINNQQFQFFVISDPIDAGRSFHFYFISACPGILAGGWDQSATALVAGQNKEVATTIYLPQGARVPNQMIVNFGVSDPQDWVGNGPCL